MSEFVTIATFEYVMEAELMKMELEQEGFEAFLVDDQVVAMDPLLSAAIGGIKVQVPTKHAKPAQVFVETCRAAKAKKKTNLPDVTFDCDECGKSMTFLGHRRGGVEDCPHCHCYVDVPD